MVILRCCFFLQSSAKRCTKIFLRTCTTIHCALNLLFADVLVSVAVVVYFQIEIPRFCHVRPWYLIIAKNEFEIGMINYKRRKHQTEKRTFCVSSKRRASLLFTYYRHCNSLFLFLNSHNPFTWHVNRYLVMALIIRAQSVNTCFASITILLFFARVALFLERSSKTRHRIFNEEFRYKMWYNTTWVNSYT